MEWTQMSAEEDLRWYFQVAEHECCFLSSFGGSLAKAAAFAAKGKVVGEYMKVHEEHACKWDNDPTDARLDAAAKMRDMHKALTKLSARMQIALEHQYSGGPQLGDVSLALVASQPSTRVEHARFVAGRRKANERRLADLARRKSIGVMERGKPTPKPKKTPPPDNSTPRDWILWMLATDINAAALQTVIAEARAELAAAIAAYIEASKVAE